MAGEKRRLRPVLDGKFWTIGDNPDLGSTQGKRGDGKKTHGQEHPSSNHDVVTGTAVCRLKWVEE